MKKYINRTIEKKINEIVDTFPALIITGPRQVGKTTLLKYIESKSNKKINYVSLDDLLTRKQAIEDPNLFLKSHTPPLIIDEFQYAKDLLIYIKIQIDEARNNELFGTGDKVETMYYLTGSQVFRTIECVSESLAGRVALLDLYGLSTREILGLDETPFLPEISKLKKKEQIKYKNTKEVFERIINGSYPEINTKGIDRETFYSAYLKTYIERDIRELINVKDEIKFIKFITSVAARTAQEYNALDIANDVEVSSKTVDEWMSILKNTHLVYLLSSYSNNNVQKAIKRPKIYFMDTGLACYLTGYLNSEILEKSAYNGAIFETYVITEIIKSYTNNGKDPRANLYYYRDKLKKEIDLLIIDNNKVYPIEIKKSANPSISALKNFNEVKLLGLEVCTGGVICLYDNLLPIDENNYYIPLGYL